MVPPIPATKVRDSLLIVLSYISEPFDANARLNTSWFLRLYLEIVSLMGMLTAMMKSMLLEKKKRESK